MATVMMLARDERADFADFLEKLTAQQWEGPSLCQGWRVHDLVAHVISYEPLSARQTAGRVVRGLVTKGGPNAIGVAEFSALPPDGLIELFHRYPEPRGATASFGGRVGLTDGLIHQQDIRRPLGMPRRIPADRLLVALDFARWAPPIRGGLRARGLRLVATDLDWSAGRGPEVSGPAEALLMAMAGRADAVADLDGPGWSRFAQRLGAGG
ncbi:maleylpyruvate isomerase family mycothiol-dependent enzyme [Mycobacterium sp. TNTM28]|uniref:Maleylpyruvate isomerase family mycothiol-dependent enzyme n=1 Tax=[Mycobacterium] fortunisiensis TaxID=2600579 RepID=A0ABS6KQ76_9MYCO|nr:maleylpyruvate isomerase family mycothiol-dependent enzyme [[Mycobacterium] fortunisiensis]MBU9765777.1 maleylpyruvate isomerase family mycothiol-dependent enzyme [[Mycobacterium] fortunisiensis]